MPNNTHSHTYTSDDSLSFEQPQYERFFHRNVEVLDKLLGLSNREPPRIGLPRSSGVSESVAMRSMLIDWLRQINSFRCSKPGVLALTVEIIDNYVHVVSSATATGPMATVAGGGLTAAIADSGAVPGHRVVDAKNYQCLGASAYHLASKLEEVAPVTAADMSRFTSDSCSPGDIMNFEIFISYKLGFSPKYVTPIDFIYVLVGFIDYPAQSELIKSGINCYLEVIDNYSIKKYPPHIIAVNSIIIGYYEIDINMIDNKNVSIHHRDKNNNNKKDHNYYNNSSSSSSIDNIEHFNHNDYNNNNNNASTNSNGTNGYSNNDNNNNNSADMILNNIVDTLIKLVNPNKNELSACYELINGLIEAKKSQCVDANSSYENIDGI